MFLSRAVPSPLSLVASVALLALAGCSGEPPKSTPAPAEKPAEAPVAEAAPAPAPMALADLQGGAENVALVPSPVEMQKAMEKAGIADGLSKLVTDRTFKVDAPNADVVAVRTGVVLADVLLTVKDAPKEKLVAQLNTVKTGLNTLGAGPDIAASIDGLTARITNDGISRDDLVKELDEMRGAVIPELKFQAGDSVLPLIEAGGWLEGSNLVSSAILTANKPDAGSQLLRQPEVVDYFLKYVKTEGADKASAAVLTQLTGTLTKLKEIAAKPALTADDVKEVKAQTDSVLALL